MTTAPPGSIISGIYWHNQAPVLATADPDGAEHEHPLTLGHRFALSINGARRCIGVWLAPQRRRRPCPFRRPVAAGSVSAQCEACAAVDHGHALARDEILDDGRRYTPYLAWFGPDLPKIGLTALDRGADRLAEQGALAYTLLGRGPLPAARALEKAVAASGLAPERRHRNTKITAWRRRLDLDQRRRHVSQLYQRLVDAVPWPTGLDRDPCLVIDQAEAFGLDHLPTQAREITALHPGATITGTLLCVIGRELLIQHPAHGAMLLDTRHLAGWPASLPEPTTTDLPTSTVTLSERPTVLGDKDTDHDAHQPSLF